MLLLLVVVLPPPEPGAVDGGGAAVGLAALVDGAHATDAVVAIAAVLPTTDPSSGGGAIEPKRRVAHWSIARKHAPIVPASKRSDCDAPVHQTSVAAASSTCSVAKVRLGWPCATVIARAEVKIGTSSMSERKAPPCVNALCASSFADATLDTSSQMLPVNESHCADEPESGTGREGRAVPGLARVRV